MKIECDVQKNGKPCGEVPDYYYAGEIHVCRMCASEIRHNGGGRYLRPINPSAVVIIRREESDARSLRKG